jgi:solute:Na+ symporter, SSS family
VQRILATANLSAARKALVGSGVVVILQFGLFLLVGTVLWKLGIDDGVMDADTIFPQFIIDYLPPGLSGLVVAGLLAAAMSTVSSSLNSLASSTTHDFYGPLTGESNPDKLLRVGRLATIAWAVVLAGLALIPESRDQPVVIVALAVASIMYGGLLGLYVLGALSRIRQLDAMVALIVSSVIMMIIFVLKPGPLGQLAFTWYVPLGLLLTLVTGFLTSFIPTR